MLVLWMGIGSTWSTRPLRLELRTRPADRGGPAAGDRIVLPGLYICSPRDSASWVSSYRPDKGASGSSEYPVRDHAWNQHRAGWTLRGLRLVTPDYSPRNSLAIGWTIAAFVAPVRTMEGDPRERLESMLL